MSLGNVRNVSRSPSPSPPSYLNLPSTLQCSVGPSFQRATIMSSVISCLLFTALYAATRSLPCTAIREVSGMLTVHHSVNLKRMHSHMHLWEEELSTLPASLSELPFLLYQHKKGELSMLTHTLLRESSVNPGSPSVGFMADVPTNREVCCHIVCYSVLFCFHFNLVSGVIPII